MFSQAERREISDLINSSAEFHWLNYFEFHPERIIDVGCGNGRRTLGILHHFNPRLIVGVDISSLAIRQANQDYDVLQTTGRRILDLISQISQNEIEQEWLNSLHLGLHHVVITQPIYFEGDILEGIPDSDKKFQMAYSRRVLRQLNNNLPRAFMNVFEILEPGGVYVVQDDDVNDLVPSAIEAGFEFESTRFPNRFLFHKN